MTKRLACLSAFLMLVLLPSFGFQDAGNAQNGLAAKSQTVSPVQRHKASRAAISDWSRRMKGPSAPPPTNIGFLSATQTPAGAGTFPNFPAVTGDFKGDGKIEAAAVVNTAAPPAAPTYNIAVQLYQGNGVFTTKLTQINMKPEPNPIIFAGNLSGHKNGEDDVLIVHPAIAGSTVESWISNGDGTFTSVGIFPATKNGFVWATIDNAGNVTVADSASPNGNICTLTNFGNGTFNPPSCVAFTGALNSGSSSVPGNPMVFADFNGDGFLDFAAPAAVTNQIMVYLCTSKTNPCNSYSAPTALTTTDGVYDSCFLGGGPLKTGGGFGELVSANCLNNNEDDNITVYVNSAGTFAPGVYTTVGSDPVAVTVADVNGDGNTDIVTSCFRSADIKVLIGDGSGGATLGPVGYVTGGSPLVPPLVADFNGDGKPDVVVPDNEFSFVYLEGYGDGTFRSAVNYYATPGGGANAQAVNIATGDFNGDGIPDFVIGNTNSFSSTGITVFLSNKDGSLQTGVNYNNNLTNYSLQYVAVADFNGDKILDIAASDNVNGVVEIFTGKGDGTFPTAPTPYPSDTATGPNPVGLIVGDFNGDGKPDLAVINNHGSPAATADVGILINNGKGGFNPVVVYPLSTVATEITAADVNGDGKLDLVVPLYGTSTKAGNAVAILLGNGNGTFQAEKDVSLGAYLNPYDAAVGDLNGDGKVDLAVTIEDQSANPSQGIAVAFGNGNGTFGAPTLLLSTLQNPKFDVPLPGYVKIVDLNQDGIPDLVYSNSEFSTVGILYGKGAGAFYDPVEFPADRWAWGLALVDLNGDGGTDVVASGNSFDFSGVAVLFNSGGNKMTLTSSLNPSTLGASVTFTATVLADVKGVTAIPTGKVTFNDGKTALGSATLSSTGVATFSTTALGGGTHSITAQYSGDVNFLKQTSAALSQVVAPGTVSILLASSPNPSTVGQSVAFTATVADSQSGGTFVPSGKVTFNDGTTALGSGTLSSTGVATLNTTALTVVGTHSITAQYGGDVNFQPKTSAALSQKVQATAVPDYTLSASGGQTVNPGSPATYTITVSTTTGYNGTVSFLGSSCGGLPTGALCSFAPSSITGSGTTKLTITTTAPTAALLALPAGSTPQKGALDLWASLGGLGLVGVVLAGDWSSRRRRRLGIVLAVLAVIFLVTLVGCGGGSSSSGGGGGGGGGGTPAGTYPIQVTVTGTAGTNGGSTAPHTLKTPLTLIVI
jgi:hypothetical protein